MYNAPFVARSCKDANEGSMFRLSAKNESNIIATTKLISVLC